MDTLRSSLFLLPIMTNHCTRWSKVVRTKNTSKYVTAVITGKWTLSLCSRMIRKVLMSVRGRRWRQKNLFSVPELPKNSLIHPEPLLDFRGCMESKIVKADAFTLFELVNAKHNFISAGRKHTVPLCYSSMPYHPRKVKLHRMLYDSKYWWGAPSTFLVAHYRGW